MKNNFGKIIPDDYYLLTSNS